jgi:hypothetical protein
MARCSRGCQVQIVLIDIVGDDGGRSILTIIFRGFRYLQINNQYGCYAKEGDAYSQKVDRYYRGCVASINVLGIIEKLCSCGTKE